MHGELWLVLFMVCTATTGIVYLGCVVWLAIRNAPDAADIGEADGSEWNDRGGGGVLPPDPIPPRGQRLPRRRPPGDRVRADGRRRARSHRTAAHPPSVR